MDPPASAVDTLFRNNQLMEHIWPKIYQYLDTATLLRLRLLGPFWNTTVMQDLTEKKIHHKPPCILWNSQHIAELEKFVQLFETVSTPWFINYTFCTIGMELCVLLDSKIPTCRYILGKYGHVVKYFCLGGIQTERINIEREESGEVNCCKLLQTFFGRNNTTDGNIVPTGAIQVLHQLVYKWCPNLDILSLTTPIGYTIAADFIHHKFDNTILPLKTNTLKLRSLTLSLQKLSKPEIDAIAEIIKKCGDLKYLELSGNFGLDREIMGVILEKNLIIPVTRIKMDYDVLQSISRVDAETKFAKLQTMDVITYADEDLLSDEVEFPVGLTTKSDWVAGIVNIEIHSFYNIIHVLAVKNLVFLLSQKFPVLSDLSVKAAVPGKSFMSTDEDDPVPGEALLDVAILGKLTKLCLRRWDCFAHREDLLHLIVRAFPNLAEIKFIHSHQVGSEECQGYLKDTLVTNTLQILSALRHLKSIRIECRWISNLKLLEAFRVLCGFRELAHLSLMTLPKSMFIHDLNLTQVTINVQDINFENDQITDEDGLDFAMEALEIAEELEHIHFEMINFKFSTRKDIKNVEFKNGKI